MQFEGGLENPVAKRARGNPMPPQGSDAWFAQRRDKVTASNLGALLGFCKHTSRETAVLRAQGRDPFQGNEATRWGQAREQEAIEAYKHLTGHGVACTGAHTHAVYDWFLGSPDGLVQTDGLVEIKCPFYHRKMPNGTTQRVHSDIPDQYLIQCLALLEVTDRAWCDFVSWSPEGMVAYRVYAAPHLMKLLIPLAKEMHDYIVGKRQTMPECQKDSSFVRAAMAQAKHKVNKQYWAHVTPGLEQLTPPPSPTSPS